MSPVNAVTTHGDNLSRLLGRRHAPDTRDYGVSALVARKALAAAPPSRRSWRNGPILNQGQVFCPLQDTLHPFCKEQGFCVGAGSKGFLMSDPVRTLKGPSLLDIYHIAQTLDEWDGINYSGTSVRAGLKTLQRLGNIATYAALATPYELQMWLGTQGSVLVGINWYEQMFQPDTKGFMTLGGNCVGGHCLEVSLLDISAKSPSDWFYGGPNSWGAGWGYKGHWRMKAPDFHKLLFDEAGEVFAANEVKLK